MFKGNTSLIQELMQRKLRIPSALHKMDHTVRLSRSGQHENQPVFKQQGFGGGNLAKSFSPKSLTSSFNSKLPSEF